MTARLFSNGSTMVFDDLGEQIPELQKNYIILLIEFFESQGIYPTQMKIIMGCYEIVPIKTQNNTWNYRLK